MQDLDNSDDIVVPDEILKLKPEHFDKSNDKSNASGYRKKLAKSAFIITINPNLGKKIFANTEQVKIEYKRLYVVNKKFEKLLQEGNFIKEKCATDKPSATFIPPKVVQYSGSVETGTQNGFLHIQAYLELDDCAHVDLAKIRDWLKEFYAHKVYVKAKFVQVNTKAGILDYIGKGSAVPNRPSQPDQPNEPEQPDQPNQSNEPEQPDQPIDPVNSVEQLNPIKHIVRKTAAKKSKFKSDPTRLSVQSLF